MKRFVLLLAIATMLGGCATGGLSFRRDDRVDIVRPGDRAKVKVPVTISWTADGISAGKGGPYFAVFVDQSPIKPGQSLRALADDSCNRTKGCPDLQYFRDRYVYVTDRHSVTLDAVPQKSSSSRKSARDHHEATIVLVDGDGRRMGESAFTREFTVAGR